MSAIERSDLAVIGSGEAGKYLAWTLSKASRRTALVAKHGRKIVSERDVGFARPVPVLSEAGRDSWSLRVSRKGQQTDGLRHSNGACCGQRQITASPKLTRSRLSSWSSDQA